MGAGWRGRSGQRAALVASVGAVAVGGWLLHAGQQTSSPPVPSAADALRGPAGGSSTGSPAADRPSPTAMAFSLPTRIRIPSIGVDAPVAPVDLTSAGDLPAPSATDRNLAGWYVQSAAPGSTGSAVLDGHVDTMQGPAVFYLLGRLHRGDLVEIARTDGSIAEFTVDATQLYSRAAVPSQQVFGPADTPQLRLITCGGTYTKATGYQGTTVVYAHLGRTAVATPPPGPRDVPRP